MQESQERAKRLRPTHKAKIVSPKMPYYGMTPGQIRKCVQGSTAETASIHREIPAFLQEDKPIRVKKKAAPNQANKLLLELPLVTVQPAILYSTPDWFTIKQGKAELSIIIPIRKSAEDVVRLIESWDLSNEGIRTELIFVDDNCPQNSKDHVIMAWSKRQHEIKKPIGRIYYSSEKQGIAAICNLGAFHATGDHLIFLDPTNVPVENWIKPMLRSLRQNDVGLVTNMCIREHLRIIENAGSEWDWSQKRFLQIGKESYNGKPLIKSFQLDNCPEDLSKLSEREAATSGCICIKKSLFQKLGGFNPNYQTKIWKDSDLSLAIREMNLKIVYQPNSKLLGPTTDEVDNRSFARDAIFFSNKWINSGRIDPLVRNKRIESKMEIRSIVIKREAAFGDVLIAAAVAPALKKKHPGASIIFNTNCHEVLKDNPFIDRVVFEEQISERSFQILYNLNFAYEYKPTTNILQAYAESVGVDRSDCSLFLKTEPIEGLPEKFIVVHAGKTAWVGRDWSPMKFDVLAKRLRKDDYKIVCVGTGYDHLVSSDLDLRGKTSVNQLAYVMQKATAFVGIDSFPMHVAQVFDTPGVCFFGSIKPETRIISNKMIPVVAQGISCLGCHHKQPAPCTVTNQCETVTQDCINLVSIDQMIKKVQAVLETVKNG